MTNERGQLKIKPKSGATENKQSLHRPSELIDPTGRRLILIATDCIADIWKDRKILSVLKPWAANGPMAVLQMLPEWLWARTALGFGAQAQFHALAPGLPNQRLDVKKISFWDEVDLAVSIRVPVVTLEPEPFLNWSKMVSAKGGAWSPGFVFEESIFSQDSDPLSLSEEESPEQRVHRFRTTASPVARQLAGLLSAAPMISLPIVRIIREKLLSSSRQVHVAEVFLSGLLKPLSDIQFDTIPDQVQYDFFDGVRDLLLTSMPTSAALKIYNEVSEYIADHLDMSASEFAACVMNPNQIESRNVSQYSQSFARISAQILGQLGGQYAQFSKQLEASYSHLSNETREVKDVFAKGNIHDQIRVAIEEEWIEFDLSDRELIELPDTIAQLSSLKTLSLGNNQLTSLPEAIAQLSKLETLSLERNQLTSLPEAIAQLSKLETLSLERNQLTSLPEAIAQLSNLKTLSLGNNQLTSLPEAIAQLSKLETLSLERNQLTSLPEAIAQLSKLETLSLERNQLTSLPEAIAQLSSLKTLNLEQNLLAALPEGVAQLSLLQTLTLNHNQLSTLPERLGQLASLQSLNLSDNRLSSLPSSAQSLKKLDNLDLRGNPLPIPPEILGPKESWKNPGSATEILGFYFSLQTETGSVPLYEAKLILVGEGGAGKTSLAKKIDNADYELPKDEKSTEGIDVIRWDFPLPEGNTFRVNIWDFGGQEIYHATHQFFLSKRSLYLLVADTRQESTDFYYWLKIVELLADSSPVIIIKNEKQNRQCEIDEGLFKSQFNNLKDSFPTNLKDGRGLDDIKDAIRYHISKLPHVGNPLPKIWVRVRAALENYSQNCNTLTVEQYFDICRQNGFTDKDPMLLLSSYLHDLGICLHFQDDKLLKRTVILKPEWATTAVYRVTDSDTVRKNKGRFTESDIAELWSDSQYSDLRDELLQLMMRFKLAYEVLSTPGHYIAPQLLSSRKPLYSWDTTDNLILRYRYDFMPKGIFTRFIIETHLLIENQDHVWKSGIILANQWARAEIIENYPKNEITVRVSGSNKKTLIEVVRSELWKIHQSYERLEYQELIPCNCPRCKGNNKPEVYPYELLMKYISDHRYVIECRASFEQVDVRRLISDITDQSNRPDADKPLDNFSPASPPTSQAEQLSERDINNSIVIVGSNNQDNLDLTSSAREIKSLLEKLSEEYNPNSTKGQAKIEAAALAEIKQNPIKQRILKALQSAGDEALEQAIDHPVAKVVVKGIKGFLQG